MLKFKLIGAIMISFVFFIANPIIALAEDYSVSLFGIDYYQFTGQNHAGTSVSSAGDVNNDGFADFLIGAASAGGPTGACYLIYGDEAKLSTASLSGAIVFLGEAVGDMDGFSSCSSAGDVNNDGYDDVIIGALRNDSSIQGNEGAAYLIYGQADTLSNITLSSTTAVKFTGEDYGDYAGISVSSAGDVNHDGYDDIIIGAYGNDTIQGNEGNQTGAAYLIYGQADTLSNITLSSTTAVKFTGAESSGGMAGFSVDSAGDVNGDGYGDILIGDYTYGGTGAVFLIYGQADNLTSKTLDDSSIVIISGETAGRNAGQSLAAAGDVNGDGYGDILIGDSSILDIGYTYLVYGRADVLTSFSLSSTTAVKFTGKSANDYMGASLASAGDINNDGFDDIIIGAYRTDTYYIDGGEAYLIYGQADALASSPIDEYIAFYGQTEADDAGRAVSSAGDVNNDGYDDILIGAPLNDDGGDDTGAAYLGYLYIDSDHDGIAGMMGVFQDTDCNDEDATISTNQIYYQDLDNDGLGNPDVSQSVCSNTAPEGYVGDNTDINDSIKDILSIVGTTNGDILITYINNDTATIDVFNYTTSKTTIIGQFNDQYYVALSHNGKKIALVDIINLTVLSTKALSKSKNYSVNKLILATLRTKDTAVVVSKKKASVLLSLVRINTTTKKIAVKNHKTTNNINIKPAKTTVNKNRITLKDSSGAVLEHYLVTKKLKLILQ